VSRQFPLTATAHWPVRAPLERVQPPAGDIHILRPAGIVQPPQLSGEFPRVLRPDAGPGAGDEKPLQTPVPKTADHGPTVSSAATHGTWQGGRADTDEAGNVAERLAYDPGGFNFQVHHRERAERLRKAFGSLGTCEADY
jgi:hypothetical protein